MSEKKRDVVSKADFTSSLRHIAMRIAETIVEDGEKVYDKLTQDELWDFTMGLNNYRFPKVVAEVMCDRIPYQFGSESTRNDVKKLRRILRNRR